MAEQMNDRNIGTGGSKEWTNPSKNLVDKALERWSTTRMRADNTSVVIIMLDPPGPPKRDVLRSCSTPPYQIDYLPNCLQPADVQNQMDQESDNFTMYDHSTNEHIDLDALPLPTSGLAIMTRYENANGEFAADKHAYIPVDSSQAHSSNTDMHYMNSFAESYTKFVCRQNLNSNLENDHAYIYNSARTPETEHGAIDYDDDSGDGSNHYVSQHQTESYSLTKLETRTEQQINSQRINLFGESSTAACELVGQVSAHGSAYSDFQEHSYMGGQPFGSLTRSYVPPQRCEVLASSSSRYENVTTEELPVEASVNNTFQDLRCSYYESEIAAIETAGDIITVISVVKEPSSAESTAKLLEPCEIDSPDNEPDHNIIETCISSSPLPDTHPLEKCIQINEISSSDCEVPDQSNVVKQDSRTSTAEHPSKSDGSNYLPEKKMTRSTAASLSPQVRRSTRHDQKLHHILKKCKTDIKKSQLSTKKAMQGLKSTLAAIIQKSTNDIKSKIHKENISMLRKMGLNMATKHATTSSSNISRTRQTTVLPPSTSNDLRKRTLRSQNTLTKEVKRQKDTAWSEHRRIGSPAMSPRQNVAIKSTRYENVIGKKLPKLRKIKVQITRNFKNNNNVQLINQNTVVTRSLRELKSPKISGK